MLVFANDFSCSNLLRSLSSVSFKLSAYVNGLFGDSGTINGSDAFGGVISGGGGDDTNCICGCGGCGCVVVVVVGTDAEVVSVAVIIVTGSEVFGGSATVAVVGAVGVMIFGDGDSSSVDEESPTD